MSCKYFTNDVIDIEGRKKSLTSISMKYMYKYKSADPFKLKDLT